MSEQQNFGFGKFVPGFDFLQNLAKGSTQPQAQAGMTSLSSWVAPTLNVEELDKRIGELKAVSFWLDQNAKALAATIQALELQKMTLATLRGMNFNMAEMADAMKLKPAAAASAAAPQAGVEPAQAGPDSVAGAARDAVAKARASKKTAAGGGNGQPSDTKAAGGVVDPLQWWGALTQQFQEIAAGAMRDGAANPAGEIARDMAAAATGQTTPPVGGKRNAASSAAGKGIGKGAAPRRSATAKKIPRKSGPRTR